MLLIAVLLNTAVWLAMFAVYLKSKTASVFNPLSIYHAFHFLVFVVRPIMVHFLGFDSLIVSSQYRPSDEDYITTLSAINVGLITFQCVLLYVTRACQPSPVRQIDVAARTYPAFVTTCLLLAPVVFWSLTTGLSRGVGVRDELTGIFIQTSTTGYITDAPAVMVTLLIINVVIHRFKIWTYIPIAAYLTYHLYFAVNRWPMLVISISVILSLYYFKGRQYAVTAGIFAFIVLLPIHYLKGVDRELLLNLAQGEVTEALYQRTRQGATLQERLDIMDYAQYDMTSVFVSVYPEVSGSYTYFTQWLQLFTEPIPRVLWEGKPIGSPVKVNDFYILDVANIIGFSGTMIGWGWMSYGFLGVFIQAAVSGLIIGRFYRWFCRNGASYVVAVAYILVNSVLFQYYRDGDISIFKFLFFLGIPLGIWMLLSKIAGAHGIGWRAEVLARTPRAARGPSGPQHR